MAKHKADKHAADASKDVAREKNAGKIGYKLMASVGAALGANVARKVLTQTWKTATGKKPPENPEHLGVGAGEAAAWAAASAATVAVARVLAQRRIAETWRRASGHTPPGMPETEK